MTKTVDQRARDTFLSRVSENVASSFSETQLAAIDQAFGARQMGTHAVELRRSVPILGWDYYVVMLAGKGARRVPSARLSEFLRPVRLLTASVVLALGLSAMCATGGICLLTIKSALGVDIVPAADVLPDESLMKFVASTLS